MLCFLDILFIDFWQTIDVVVLTFDAEVLCQVDNLDVGRDGVFLEESLTLAVSDP